jgi:hypothetical protein
VSTYTERYLAAALRAIPQRQRPDVERELRSSIEDAVDDRVTAGEPRTDAERAVLEGLGDPARLAAGITGRPMYLIGPELFGQYRGLLVTLLAIVVPIVAIVVAAVELSGGGRIGSAILDGAGTGINVAVHIAFWVTLSFALIERVETVKDAADDRVGRWTVDRLPELATGQISLGETIGEVVTLLITIGGLVFLRTATFFTDEGDGVILLDPAVWVFWLPALIAVLVSLVGLHIVVSRVGRWTMPLATAHAVLQVAFAAPLVYLALTGTLINPAFADAIGYPPLAEADGPVMVWAAAATVLITGWEIVDAFRKARRGHVPEPLLA